MTFGGSLKTWKEASIIDRELALYKEHAKNGVRTTIISYGGPEEVEIAAEYDFIEVLFNQTGLHYRLYALLLPLIHRNKLSQLDFFKTNQLYGAHIASRCAFFFSKPLGIRQGYSHFENRTRESGEGSSTSIAALKYEKKYLSCSHCNIFTTQEMVNNVYQRHGSNLGENFIVPNFIDPLIWSLPYCQNTVSDLFHFVYFGRLSPEKNLKNLFYACQDLSVKITIIGDGPQKSELEELSRNLRLDISFKGKCSQPEIVQFLTKADGFVFPSLYEGHPKALIEAMAFGIPILTTNSPGIMNEVSDGVSAIVVGQSIEALRQGVQKMISMSTDERMMLGINARNKSLKKYAVSEVAAREREIIYQTVRHYRKQG
ncbi:glycosyltransferase family 4 protein [Candidatus Terasakiella magnetica]|nr:glycosyltransferase family 4 protein [Candidatus Terasakiella magnetica]